MSERTDNFFPVWAPRLRKSQIERFYKSASQEFFDTELIDDVGFSLLARCKSMLEVTEAIHGRPVCPRCKTRARKVGQTIEILECADCAWRCPWKPYQKTYQRKGLHASGLIPFVREFVERFEESRSHTDRLILIDTLIHQFHWGNVGGRPSAVSLIEGTMQDIMPFLDRLTYGDRVPEDVRKTREAWRRKWSANPWSKNRGQ